METQTTNDTWLCRCGWGNKPETTHCRKCGKERRGDEDREWDSASDIRRKKAARLLAEIRAEERAVMRGVVNRHED